MPTQRLMVCTNMSWTVKYAQVNDSIFLMSIKHHRQL